MSWIYPAVAGGVGLVFFGCALADILTDWERYRLKIRAKGSSLSRPLAAALAGAMLAVSLFALHTAWTNYRVKHPAVPKSAEAAKQYVVGTWVFAEPLPLNRPHIISWQRWIIRSDGTLDIFSAPPASDSWGQPVARRYEIDTAKYQDTGERFYCVKVLGTPFYAIIENDGALLVQGDDKTWAVLTRGDRDPFSK